MPFNSTGHAVIFVIHRYMNPATWRTITQYQFPLIDIYVYMKPGPTINKFPSAGRLGLHSLPKAMESHDPVNNQAQISSPTTTVSESVDTHD